MNDQRKTKAQLIQELNDLREQATPASSGDSPIDTADIFKTTSDSAAYGLAIADMDGSITYVNDYFASIHGYSTDEMIGQHFAICHTEEQLEEVMKINHELLKSGQYSLVEIWHKHKDGTVFPTLMSGTIITDSKGKPIHMAATAIEITERKQAQEDRELSRSLFEATLESTADGILVVSFDGSWSSFNQKFVDIWGIPNSISESGDDKAALEFILDNLAEPDEFFSKVVDLYDSPEMDSFDTIALKDGRIIERYSHPQRLQGEVVGRVWSFRDITKRRQTEEELRRHNQELAALLEVSKTYASTLNLEAVLQATTDSIAKYFDLETSAVYLLEGDELLLGATTPPLSPEMPDSFRVAPLSDYPLIEETILNKQTKFLPDTKSASFTAPEKSIIEARNIRSLLFLPLISDVQAIGILLVGSTGTPRVITDSEIESCSTLANIASLAIANSQLYKASQSNVTKLEHEVIERKQAEEDRKLLEIRMRHRQKLESIGTLASGIAHEINNPINGIMNYAEIIRMKLSEDDPLIEYATEIGRESERIATIVSNLLTFSRDDRESHSAATINDIITETLSLVQTAIRHDQITLELDVPADLPKIKCRRHQIQQVLMNLITNARDALNERYPEYDENKKLCVQVQPLKKEGLNWIRLTVEDHGAGIPIEINDRIFDPFFTTKDRAKGTGLGLSISNGIVEDHDGEISVDSEPGQYTRFHVDLRVDNGWTLDEAPSKEEN